MLFQKQQKSYNNSNPRNPTKTTTRRSRTHQSNHPKDLTLLKTTTSKNLKTMTTNNFKTTVKKFKLTVKIWKITVKSTTTKLRENKKILMKLITTSRAKNKSSEPQSGKRKINNSSPKKDIRQARSSKCAGQISRISPLTRNVPRVKLWSLRLYCKTTKSCNMFLWT